MTGRADDGLPLEEFIQALTSQLDRAQSTMALKAKAGLPLTFAVKDLSLELRAHVDMSGSAVRLRPAGPGDGDASVLHLALTTITRPMIEENAVELSAQADEPTLEEVLGDELTEDERRRLEWAGIHTVSQLREVRRNTGDDALRRSTALPVERLRRALASADRPWIRDVSRAPVEPARRAPFAEGEPEERQPLLRVRGENLLRERLPNVRIGGEPVEVVHATDRELLLRTATPQRSGVLEIESRPGSAAALAFALEDDDDEDGAP